MTLQNNSIARLLLAPTCALIFSFASSQAGFIDLTGGVDLDGPGLGTVSVPVVVTLNVDNDDQDGSTPTLDNNIVVPVKRFDNPGFIDIEFDVQPTSGTTEYAVFENVDNNTGDLWIGYRIELGFGTGSNFAPSTAGDGLSFDAPLFTPAGDFASTAFSNVSLSEDVLIYSDGVQGTASETITFRIDVPNLSTNSFTIRQIPIPVPEPSGLLIASLSILAFGGLLRRK